ncbi:MAG TPA: serine/threonine-protein kinase [Kofleriaceae bacterium]|nr:serine/threonine-protein kinase [Kofleriaceae bacterium]
MIGEIVDGHEILRPLGAGGMGEVYLARAASGTLRAFKVVRTDRQTGPQAAARFRREVLALGKLQHPGIIRILDAGTLPNGALYLGMEYVGGPDLQAAVGWDGPFPVADALRIIVQLAAALAYAHGAGVIHRDLKPANVILEEGDAGRAKIIDFGLAKIVENEGLTRLTEDKQALGSPLYWAPEQSSNTDVGPPADVYSLGGILYFLMSGEPLFKPRPAVAMVYAHTHEQPQPLAMRCRGIELPAGLDELAARCVAKLPAHRPTAAELVIELDRMLATLPSTIGQRRAAQRLFTSTGLSNMQDALTNQMRQVLLDLASVLQRPTDDIDRIQQELSELELDFAVLESDVQMAVDPEVEERHAGISQQMAQLQAALTDAYRELFDAVSADRNRAVPDAHALFSELDSLVEQYRSL